VTDPLVVLPFRAAATTTTTTAGVAQLVEVFDEVSPLDQFDPLPRFAAHQQPRLADVTRAELFRFKDIAELARRRGVVAIVIVALMATRRLAAPKGRRPHQFFLVGTVHDQCRGYDLADRLALQRPVDHIELRGRLCRSAYRHHEAA